MTALEFEYDEGRKAFLVGKPFSSTKSVAWQNGWINAYDFSLMNFKDKEKNVNDNFDWGYITLNAS